jgi:hypothetical protein
MDGEITLRPSVCAEIDEKTRLPGVVIHKDHNLVKIAKRYTREVTGNTWKAVGAGPANEGYMLIDTCIPIPVGLVQQAECASCQ